MGMEVIDPAKIPLSLYVHWPWCVRKCPYCDFNSHALETSRGTMRSLDEERYVEALKKDLDEWRGMSAGRRLQSVFFGGGTPSLMSPDAAAEVLSYADRTIGLAPECEVTLEANPGTVDEAKFRGFKAAGVNRLSIGVQSFDDERLRLIGRIHSRAEALSAAEKAAGLFDSFNLDLMFGLPTESRPGVMSDVETALSTGAQHLSFYQLTIEEGTAFAKSLPADLPDSEALDDMGDAVALRLEEAGFVHYEVSGYAKPGKFCRHNLNYWTYGDYFGIGAGAHGKASAEDGIYRAARSSGPSAYMNEVLGGRGLSLHKVDEADVPFEFMLNALRLREGVAEELWVERTGLPLSFIAEKRRELEEKGLLVPGRIQTTQKGYMFLSLVQEEFL